MKHYFLYVVLFLTLVMSAYSVAEQKATISAERELWLKDLFSKQHDALIPKVAVADMFYACNLESNNQFGSKKLAELINHVSKDRLAEKLNACLNGDSVKSERAIDYGLLGCFHDQLDELPDDEKQQKITLVKKAIASLSLVEKTKSLSQCVTDQAISYLK